MGVRAFPVAHHPIEGQVEVVDDHRAAKAQRRLDRLLKTGKLRIQFFLAGRGVVLGLGPELDVPLAGVDVDEVRGEGFQRAVVEHQILEEQGIAALVEFRPDAVGQQEQFQDVLDLADGAAAHQGHFFGDEARLLQQFALDAPLLLQDQGGVEITA